MLFKNNITSKESFKCNGAQKKRGFFPASGARISVFRPTTEISRNRAIRKNMKINYCLHRVRLSCLPLTHTVDGGSYKDPPMPAAINDKSYSVFDFFFVIVSVDPLPLLLFQAC